MHRRIRISRHRVVEQRVFRFQRTHESGHAATFFPLLNLFRQFLLFRYNPMIVREKYPVASAAQPRIVTPIVRPSIFSVAFYARSTHFLALLLLPAKILTMNNFFVVQIHSN